MEPQIWITGQIAIDVIIAGVLLLYIRYHHRGQKADLDFHTVILRAEKILFEMDQISKGLERNLEEKKKLGQRILNRLDERLQGAEECRLQLEKTMKQYIMKIDNTPPVLRDTDQARKSVKALLEKGLTREEIARNLEISLGEIDLLLKLQMDGGKSEAPIQPEVKKWIESLPKQETTRPKNS